MVRGDGEMKQWNDLVLEAIPATEPPTGASSIPVSTGFISFCSCPASACATPSSGTCAG